MKSIKGCLFVAACMLCTSLLHGAMCGEVTMKAKGNVNTQIIQVQTIEKAIVKSIVVKDKDNKVITSLVKVYPSVQAEVSEDQVGIKTAEVTLEFSDERIIELAQETSDQQPLKVHIECPTDIIKEYIKNDEINHVAITIQIPDSVIKKRNIQLEEILLRSEVITTLIKSEKSMTIRIIGEDKIEQYLWFIDGKQQDKQTLNITDLNLMLNIRTANDIECNIIEQLYAEINEEKEYLLIEFSQQPPFPVQAKIRISLDYVSNVREGDQVRDISNNLYDPTIKDYDVDVNGQISLHLSERKLYIFEIIQ